MVMIGTKEYNEAELAVLAKAGVLQIGEKHDTSATTPTAQALHGAYPGNAAQYGLFTQAGVRPGMWNGTARIDSVGSIIPMMRSEYLNEIIEISTGVTTGSGNNSTNACVVGPKAGDLKVMSQVYTFGVVHLSTRIDDITQIGMKKNRADVPREFYNQASLDNPWLPQVPGIEGLSRSDSRLRAAMYTLGVELERNISPVHFVGVAGTENNDYRGVARQWAGLDALIKTGYTDSVSNQLAPKADSVVQTFNALISGSDAEGRDIVEAVSDLWFSVNAQADALKIGGVNWAFVMRPDTFKSLVEVWACSYLTYRCSGTATEPVNQTAEAIYEARVSMTNGKYLLIEGVRVPVVLDSSIARGVAENNLYISDIYLVALSAGGQPLLYGEYFPMDNAEAEEFASFAGLANAETTTVNGGMYRVFKRVTGGCYEFDFFARPRLILDSPFLSGRLDDVRYNSYFKQVDATPGMSYYQNGGVTYR